MQKIAIIYPKDSKNKMASMRLVKNNSNNYQKITMIADLSKENATKLVQLGCEVIVLGNGYTLQIKNRRLQDIIDKLNNQILILREMFENGVLKVYPDKMNKKYEKCLEDL